METSPADGRAFALDGEPDQAGNGWSKRRRSMPSIRTRVLSMALLLAVVAPGVALAQTKNAPAAAAEPKAPLPVSVEQALYLIRSTLLTLHDANRTNNYPVLRDLAAPDLQAKNTAADLSQVFADLRQRKADLTGVALAPPQLTATPSLDSNRMLRLVGYFPTTPLQINFELLFQNVEGRWRIFGISVATPPAPPPPPAQSKAPAQKKTNQGLR